MSYHIISIDEETCYISVANGQLNVKTPEQTRSIPLEDVAAIIITSYRCELSLHFLTSAAREGIGLVLCERHKPVALLLPAIRATDTALLRNLARVPNQLRKRLWQKTVTAKCLNQTALAATWNPSDPCLQTMKKLSISDKNFKEAEVAKLYWKSFATASKDESFKRNREASDLNALFNYAYAVLLSFVMGRLFAIGLDPCYGIFHMPRAQSTPLAYDLMEPFRPAFDAHILKWIQQQQTCGKTLKEIATITTEYRKHIMGTLLTQVEYQQRSLQLRYVIELALRSFRAAIIAQQSTPYEPWHLSTTKWDG